MDFLHVYLHLNWIFTSRLLYSSIIPRAPLKKKKKNSELSHNHVSQFQIMGNDTSLLSCFPHFKLWYRRSSCRRYRYIWQLGIEQGESLMDFESICHFLHCGCRPIVLREQQVWQEGNHFCRWYVGDMRICSFLSCSTVWGHPLQPCALWARTRIGKYGFLPISDRMVPSTKERTANERLWVFCHYRHFLGICD